MKYTLDWLSDPEVFEVNREPAHSDHKFYSNYNDIAINPEGSFIQSLNGTWKFSYAENPRQRIIDFYKEDFPADDFDNITVPSHIQLNGYDKCQYVNTIYPWEGQEHLRPPYISERHNPVGSYVKYFDVNEPLLGKETFISFQGVETAFYVWLNGEFIGYSEDSFTPAEFNISKYLKEKNNKLAVEVYKRSSASWLEDQDFWRFSGIFRDVYLYAVPSVHIRDIKVIADYDYTVKTGRLSAEIEAVSGGTEKYYLTAYLKDKNNETIAILAVENNQIKIETENIKPWSAEQPELYSLIIEAADKNKNIIEIAETKIGFRRFELKNGIMCLNGKRIVFKGINRHEFNMKHGRVISEDDMLYDIKFMKQNNINAVRTCHYPNHTKWYQLCDEYGIYLIDEANLESHGTWQKLGACEPSWNIPASLPEWRGAVLDRAKSMYERDKNHPSVLIWSCGNESYCGDDIAEMAEYFHNADPTRLVHYEGVTWNRKYDYITDMESRMYPKPWEIEEYLQKDTGKPYISCEYMHAMGNSLGGLNLYTELEDKYEAYQGGFIWDYIDQAIETVNENGETVLAYGGDFDDRASDYGFCTNGIVYADRSYSPKVQEVKSLYSNIKMNISDGILTVENKNLFINTDYLDFVLTLEKEGKIIQKKVIHLTVPAGEQAAIETGLAKPSEPGEYVRQVSAVLNNSTPWAESGYETAFAQEVISVKQSVNNEAKKLKAEIVYGDVCIGVHGKDFSMLFDRKEGGISSLVYNGIEFITRVPKVSFWRAMTDNDIGAEEQYKLSQWMIAGKYAVQCSEKFSVIEKNDCIEVMFVYKTASVPKFEYKVIYSAYFDGKLNIKAEYPGTDSMPDIPVFAMDFKMKKAYSNFRYYGMGPEENYIDRLCGARLGVYTSNAVKNMSKYLNPQECGNRTGVRYLEVTDQNGTGLKFTQTNHPFEMSVLPYSAYEIENATHMEELPAVSCTWVRIAAKQMGVGGDDSWGAPVHDEYMINSNEPIKLEFTISPLYR